jgi:MFS family permease
VPGAIVALVIWKIMREPPRAKAPFSMGKGLKVVLKNRNVFICLLVSIFSMARLYIYTAFLVLYITKVHGYSLGITGLVFGIASIGDILGSISMGAIADKIRKRRIIMILCSGLCCLFIVVLAFLPLGIPTPLLFLVLFLGIFFSGGMAPFFLILIPAESVGPDLAGSAIGITNGAGEFLGAGIFPIFAGAMGDLFGLRYTMLVAAIVMGIVTILGLFLKKVPHEHFDQMKAPQEV